MIQKQDLKLLSFNTYSKIVHLKFVRKNNLMYSDILFLFKC